MNIINITNSLSLDNPELKIKNNESWFFPKTRFEFINHHFGFRPGCMHMILGTIGTGKSSLLRSLLEEVSQENKILFVSTEETKEEFETMLAYAKTKIVAENVHFVHESSLVNQASTVNEFVTKLDWALAESRAKIIFIDNVTCSQFHENLETAAQFANELRKFMKSREMPIVALAHTTTGVKEGFMFEAGDMRGNRMLAIKAEYLYCIASFYEVMNEHSIRHTFLRVDKSRNHSNAKKVYQMFFDGELRQYCGDKEYDYAKFLKLVKVFRKGS